MQIVFLGTGPSLPIPRMYCQCKTCQTARWPRAKTHRTRSSLLLKTRSKNILFDVSPDVLPQLQRARVHRIDAAFITHGHADAIGGVYDLVRMLAKQKHRSVLGVEKDTWQKFSAVSKKVKPWVTVKYIRPDHQIKQSGISVTPFRVPHSMTEGFPTLGFRIGKKLVYASDASSIPKASEKHIRNIDHLILDGCMWFEKQIKSHFTVDKSIRLAERLKVKHLYLTQIAHNYPPHAEAIRKIRGFCKKQKITIPVTLAYDGLKVSL